MRRKSQGAFEYILLLGGILLIVVVAVIIMRNSVLNQANRQIGGNVNVYKFQTCIPMYMKDPSSVIARWGFDESSGTTAKDIAKGWDGTLSSGTFAFDGTDGWVPGHNGNALKFNGNDYVQMNDITRKLSVPTTNKLTFTAWIKTTSTASQTIFNQNGPAFFSTQSGKLGNTISLINTANWVGVLGGSTISTGEWMHIAQVYDGASIKLYVNGRLDGSVAQDGNLQGVGCPQIGQSTGGGCGAGSEQFNGVLDDLVIYSRALSQDEIC